MKHISSLSKKGIEFAKTQLLKYDKRSSETAYNMQVAISQIEEKIAESNRKNYELGSFSTVSGRPEVIYFSDNDLNFQETEV